ncbi:MAG: DUF4115 domain-containing protein [Nitrospirae bacterium]|nr:DUF4115 domain-containing protein [Nitrospirota bacterium]
MGFLRNYARLLSLDEADVVRRFPQSLHPPPRKGAVPHPPGERDSWNRILEKIPTRIPADLRIKTTAPLIAGVLGAVVLTGVLLSVFWPSGREEAPPPAVPEFSRPEEAEFPPPPPREPTPIPVPEVTAPPSPPAATSREGESLILEYQAREETWISVVIDGGEVRSALLAQGERVQWTARERFLLTLGNAGGGDLFLNRRPLGTLGESGQVLRGIRITREGAALPSVIPGTSGDPSLNPTP